MQDVPLQSSITQKYLGVELTSNLDWNIHINTITTKANKTLGLLRRHLRCCSPATKETVYKALVRPQMEYCSVVWDLYIVWERRYWNPGKCPTKSGALRKRGLPPTVQRYQNDQRPRLAESARTSSYQQIITYVQNHKWSVWSSIAKSYEKDAHGQKCLWQRLQKRAKQQKLLPFLFSFPNHSRMEQFTRQNQKCSLAGQF